MKRLLAGFFTIVGYNWITQLGSIIVTISVLLIFSLFGLEMMAVINSPYLGIITFMILPGVFVTGLLIIPLGGLWEHRRKAKAAQGEAVPAFPVVDFNNPKTRRVLQVVLVLTLVNLFVLSLVSYKGVVYTESVEFCGQVCHTVMEPEYTAFIRSPHARVECVKCHIGPGADWFARSKLSGVRQVFAVMLDTYSKPIPSPVHQLRPSNETCEQCHWPAKFSGDRIRVVPKYLDDEENTLVYSVLLMHIGGGHGGGKGIHSWHIDPDKQTSYLALDEKRQEIAKVRVTHNDGTVEEFVSGSLEVDEDHEGEWRTMDCIDCHNRPTHIFEVPGKAMDEAMHQGLIDTTLPYIKKMATDALENIKCEPGDLPTIQKTLQDYYQQEYPELAQSKQTEIDQAIEQVQAIYSRNIFPEMNMTWRVHPNNLGHTEFPGCFRCHNEDHESESGAVIRQDCDMCHAVLAWEEEDPDILTELALE